MTRGTWHNDAPMTVMAIVDSLPDAELVRLRSHRPDPNVLERWEVASLLRMKEREMDSALDMAERGRTAVMDEIVCDIALRIRVLRRKLAAYDA